MEKYVKIYQFQNHSNEALILGAQNKTLSLLEEMVDAQIIVRHGEVFIEQFYNHLQEDLIVFFDTVEFLLDHHITIGHRDIINIFHQVKNKQTEQIKDLYLNRSIILTTYEGKQIYPQTIHQVEYIDAIAKHDVVFGIGPAGTGKTYLAVMYAMNMLKKNLIKKIILVRPVVEAGEKLGFLPGDLKEKIDPYLIPLYDALYEGMGKETVDKLIEKGVVEVAPLAYMRGRTLENAAIILDEAQNTTSMQMKMFLTRLGFHSKMIITGDITQIDLPRNASSGLVDAVRMFLDVNEIRLIQFDRSDIMRHPLVYKIIKKYEEQES